MTAITVAARICGIVDHRRTAKLPVRRHGIAPEYLPGKPQKGRPVSDGELCLPYPDLLPTSRQQVRRDFTGRRLSRATESLAQQGDSALSALAYGESDESPDTRPATGQREHPAELDYQEHDRYFHVRRTRNMPGVAFITALAMMHRAVLDNARDCGLSQLSSESLPQLSAGWETLLRYGAPAENGPAEPAVTEPAVTEPARAETAQTGATEAAARRWLLGHQYFFALMQGTIVGLNCFMQASASGDEADADAALGVAAAFMRSSAAAFRFTCDFAPVDYDRLIRPAMAPPAVRPGFSGLQTRDHAHLMGLFGEVRLMRAKIGGDRVGPAFERFADATVEAYEAHELICARFGGNVLPSLRMAARSGGRSVQPGVQVVRQMMRARLLALGCPAGGGAVDE
ncbi:hypothetical protein ACN27F_16160 [Solwaraspora sp. WMMB335]|uniref:hypothetical protein n=1 Tax=Solwaraspora sp. WMMB335 TaxID=3404118 RepID=UPI003B942964